MAKSSTGSDFVTAFARPVWVVMMVAQMVLGLVLTIGLIMKFYMLVFGTVGCTGDDPSIANLLRCTPTLVLVAHFLIAMAAFRFAAVMFSDRPMALLSPLVVALVGLFLLFVSDVQIGDVSWSLAAVILALLVTLCAAGAAQYYVSRQPPQN